MLHSFILFGKTIPFLNAVLNSPALRFISSVISKNQVYSCLMMGWKTESHAPHASNTFKVSLTLFPHLWVWWFTVHGQSMAHPLWSREGMKSWCAEQCRAQLLAVAVVPKTPVCAESHKPTVWTACHCSIKGPGQKEEGSKSHEMAACICTDNMLCWNKWLAVHGSNRQNDNLSAKYEIKITSWVLFAAQLVVCGCPHEF